MMQIPNPNHVPVRDVHARLQDVYPNSSVKKPWLTPEMISIKHENYRLFVRSNKQNTKFNLDFHPSIAWNLAWGLGFVVVLNLLLFFVLPEIFERRAFVLGWLPVLIGFLIGKAVFKKKISDQLAIFRNDVEMAMAPQTGGIF